MPWLIVLVAVCLAYALGYALGWNRGYKSGYFAPVSDADFKVLTEIGYSDEDAKAIMRVKSRRATVRR